MKTEIFTEIEMALLMLDDVEPIAKKNRPWSIWLERKTVSSNQIDVWYASGRGLHEPIEIGWGDKGQVGTSGKTKLVYWQEFQTLTADKLARGYLYTDHSYVHMSVGNMNKILNKDPSVPAPPSTIPVTSSKSPVVIPPSNWVMSDAQKNLGAPWNLIHILRVDPDGSTLKGFLALDEKGNEILKFDVDGGRDFARNYDLDIIWT